MWYRFAYKAWKDDTDVLGICTELGVLLNEVLIIGWMVRYISI